MKAVFADTSFYIALVNPKDEWHTVAMRRAQAWNERILTTEYVLLETANWLARSDDRGAFVHLADQIQSDPQTIIVWGGRDLFERGRILYSERADKDWSLTDCISFAVMHDHEIADALTGDRHFEQAGFKALLR